MVSEPPMVGLDREAIPEGNGGCPQHVEKAATMEVVEALMRVFSELPSRPAVEDVEASIAVPASADAKEMGHLAEVMREEVARQRTAERVPRELLALLEEARHVTVRLRMLQQRKEAAHIAELERWFKVLDRLIQRALMVVSSSGEEGAS